MPPSMPPKLVTPGISFPPRGSGAGPLVRKATKEFAVVPPKKKV